MLGLKCTKNRFRLGLRPRPRSGSLQRSPDPPAGFGGPTSKGRGWKGRGKEWRRGEGNGGKGKERGKGKGRTTAIPNFLGPVEHGSVPTAELSLKTSDHNCSSCSTSVFSHVSLPRVADSHIKNSFRPDWLTASDGSLSALAKGRYGWTATDFFMFDQFGHADNETWDTPACARVSDNWLVYRRF